MFPLCKTVLVTTDFVLAKNGELRGAKLLLGIRYEKIVTKLNLPTNGWTSSLFVGQKFTEEKLNRTSPVNTLPSRCTYLIATSDVGHCLCVRRTIATPSTVDLASIGNRFFSVSVKLKILNAKQVVGKKKVVNVHVRSKKMCKNREKANTPMARYTMLAHPPVEQNKFSNLQSRLSSYHQSSSVSTFIQPSQCASRFCPTSNNPTTLRSPASDKLLELANFQILGIEVDFKHWSKLSRPHVVIFKAVEFMHRIRSFGLLRHQCSQTTFTGCDGERLFDLLAKVYRRTFVKLFYRIIDFTWKMFFKKYFGIRRYDDSLQDEVIKRHQKESMLMKF
ncbi:10982_t:CDS:2 [Acaulospora morrowiae]|uniref:10982_t:CDS:1 n=1 Tax=Acaulospora morrowiae TaxID=94023 RepID=A0A9N9B336_9GLOM|nr:10982_t:CDS:2 [Acaulospora morrowiae]